MPTMAQKLPGFEYTDSYVQEVEKTAAVFISDCRQSGNVAAKAEKQIRFYIYALQSTAYPVLR